MASFNRVILMGNLTRDPETRQSQSGTFVVRGALAVNDRVPDGQGGWKEEASFIDFVLFGRRAEAFARFLRKGRSVLIEGKLRQSRWQDKESGQNRSKLEVIVDNWEFAGGRGEGAPGGQGGGDWAPASQAPPQQQNRGRAPEQSAEFPGRDDFIPDDVPF